MSEFITTKSGLTISYRRQGEGQVVICIPGWAYSKDVFERNQPALSEDFCTISYDPRSHGETTVTESGNTYAQHGRDLHEFIEALELDSVVLMGWSLGVFDAYAYMDEFGTDRVEAFVAVDESPRIIKADDQDWGEDSADGVAELLQLVGSENYLPFFSDYMAAGFVSPPDAELVRRFTRQAGSLSADQAAALLADAASRDYCHLASRISGTMPVLQVLREDWSQSALRWIAKHQPDAETLVLGNHLMLYEFADPFNAAVRSFLQRHSA